MNKLKKLNVVIWIVFLLLLCPFIINSNPEAAIKKVKRASGISVVSIYPTYGKNTIYNWNDIAIKFSENVKLGTNYKNIKLIMGKKTIGYSININKNIVYLHPNVFFTFDTKNSIIIPQKSFRGLKSYGYNGYKAINLSPVELMKLNSISRDDYKESANEFYNYIVDNYPFLEISKSLLGYDFRADKANILNMLNSSKNSDEFNDNITRILNKLIPGTHTRSIRMNLYSPTNCIYIYLNGEYVVISTTNSNIKIGDVVTKINNEPIDTYIKNSGNALISNIDPNKNKVISNSGVFLTNAKLTLTIKDASDTERNFITVMKKLNSNSPPNVQLGPSTANNIITKTLTDNETAYLKISAFKNIDFGDIDSFITSINNYKYLIIDLRNNFGGDIKLSRQLMSRLVAVPKSVVNYICLKSTPIILDKNKAQFNSYDETELLSNTVKNSLTILPNYVKNDDYTVFRVKINTQPNPIHFSGKIYILTNNSSFSATEYFCNSMKRMGAATLVGGYTGGDGILFEPTVKSLMYDLADVSYSYTIGIQEDGTINQLKHTEPDYYVEQNKEDYINYLVNNGDFSEYDTILNECLRLIEQVGAE